MHADLHEAIEFHEAIVAEGGKALVGYDTAKALANVVLLSEIPTTYDKREQRQVNAGNLLLRGVPGVGKTFFGVILAAISDAKFARLQGRADLQPTEVVGFQMINPATGELVTEFGPLASAEVILLDEINRIPLKSQSAFLEGLQDRTVTVGKTTYELPAFSFAIATMNPVELGQGTFPLSEAATDRFAIMVNIGYLPPDEEQKLVELRLQAGAAQPADVEGAHHRAARPPSTSRSSCTSGSASTSSGSSPRRGRTTPTPTGTSHSPSELVERGVDLGASPRAIICWGRLAKVWALLVSAPRRGLSGRHPGPGAVRARPSHLARPARREPRPHDRGGDRRHHRAGADPMRTPRLARGRPAARSSTSPTSPRSSWSSCKRMREMHARRSRAASSHGTGFDFVGPARLAGRRPLRRRSTGRSRRSRTSRRSSSASSNSRAPRRSSSIADCSPSTRCGVGGVPHRRRPSRARSPPSACRRCSSRTRSAWSRSTRVRRTWRRSARASARATSIHCLDAYQHGAACRTCAHGGSVSTTLGGFLRRTTLLPVISDFLFEGVPNVLQRAVAASTRCTTCSSS